MPADKKDLDQLPRVTFEDVLDAQSRLRIEIETLMEENKSVSSVPTTRKKFFNLWARATLGKSASVTPITDLPVLRQQTLDRILHKYLCGDADEFVVGWEEDEEKDKRVISLTKIWQIVLDRLNTDVFGAALQQAIALSPEHDTRTRFGGVRPVGEE